MKLIFLDIDGVLNSDAWDQTDRYKIETAGMSDVEIMLIAHHTHLDPKALNLINDLVNRSGAEVIISSTWRTKYKPDVLTDMMQKRGATFVIKDSTPILFGRMSERIPRGKEISTYIDSLDERPESFVILDDRSDMIYLQNSLVLTDIRFGITMADVEKALKILNGKI